MGYSCSTALSYEVDGIELYQAKREFISNQYDDDIKASGMDLEKLNNLLAAFKEVHHELKIKKVKVSLDNKEPLFFNDVNNFIRKMLTLIY